MRGGPNLRVDTTRKSISHRMNLCSFHTNRRKDVVEYLLEGAISAEAMIETFGLIVVVDPDNT